MCGMPLSAQSDRARRVTERVRDSALNSKMRGSAIVRLNGFPVQSGAYAHCSNFKACRLDRDDIPERQKQYARQATPCFRRGCATKRRSAGVGSVQMILSATTARTEASGGAVEEVASGYTESGRLQA